MSGDIQRVYHFVELEYGLDDLRRRRLKVAELLKLNDPFEFFGANLSNPDLRRAFHVMKDQMASNRGILCFSRNWKNPVQWSHYAGMHTGLCLGFDIPSEHLGAVNYSSKRFAVDANRLLNPREIDFETAKALLFTKYSHWRYENEVRSFVTLEEVDPESGLYFADFSDRLKLVEVIVGANSTLKEAELMEALGDLQADVKVSRARLAFGSFQVVRQRDKKLWWPNQPTKV
ncbi:DUF2971 domain-containing protein [Parvibaculum sp.]|uniref:DUF2971 domain-containing protein n=1 Tax=Parvibaculum sp. TaxID=2024848 RepID=UPI003297304F